MLRIYKTTLIPTWEYNLSTVETILAFQGVNAEYILATPGSGRLLAHGSIHATGGYGGFLLLLAISIELTPAWSRVEDVGRLNTGG